MPKAQNRPKYHYIYIAILSAGGGPTETIIGPRKGADNRPPDSVVTLFFHSGTHLAVGPAQGPAGLVAGCLLDARAPPDWPTNLVKSLKYYVLQLGGPNPNSEGEMRTP